MATCSVWNRAQLVLHSVRPQTCVEQPLVAVVLVSALKPLETHYIAACQLGMTLDPRPPQPKQGSKSHASDCHVGLGLRQSCEWHPREGDVIRWISPWSVGYLGNLQTWFEAVSHRSDRSSFSTLITDLQFGWKHRTQPDHTKPYQTMLLFSSKRSGRHNYQSFCLHFAGFPLSPPVRKRTILPLEPSFRTSGYKYLAKQSHKSETVWYYAAILPGPIGT
jgi:hypothetical protein